MDNSEHSPICGCSDCHKARRDAALDAAKELPSARRSAADCSPVLVAVEAYMGNRLSLVKSLGDVSYVYGQNGSDKAKGICHEIARIDEIVARLVSQENSPINPTKGSHNS